MKLFFREQGEGSPLIILHGVFGSSDNWLTPAKILAEDFKVYLLDQRNHGRSPHDPEFSYTAMANDLKEFLEDLNIKEANIIGHSMGGKVAMTLAVNHPDKVNKLIIVDIAPKYYPPHHQKILEGLNSLKLKEISDRAEADSQLGEYIKELGVRQFLLKNLTRENNAYKWRINLPVIDKEIENIGEALTTDNYFERPTLFIRGGKSKYILDEDFDLIKQFFPKAQIQTIPSAGHWIQAETPEEFLDIVTEFLKK